LTLLPHSSCHCCCHRRCRRHHLLLLPLLLLLQLWATLEGGSQRVVLELVRRRWTLADLDAPEPRMQMRLRLARERLAEAVAEVTRHHPRDATTALDAYAVLIVAAREDLEAAGHEAPADFRQYAETLLEHRYIVATEYFDLPRDTRPVLAAAITAAAAQYSRVRARFSRREQESLFFKEEEVRWAWEQAQAADAQGL
jgi:hypothetical protein